MKKTLLLLLALLAAPASAQLTVTRSGICDSGEDRTLYPVYAPCSNGRSMGITIRTDVLAFDHGSTIDFADYTLAQPGPLRGYVYVKVQGEWFLMPYYALR